MGQLTTASATAMRQGGAIPLAEFGARLDLMPAARAFHRGLPLAYDDRDAVSAYRQ